jgi:hypothetical protein
MKKILITAGIVVAAVVLIILFRGGNSAAPIQAPHRSGAPIVTNWKAELILVEKKNQMIYPTVRFTNSQTGETFDQVFQGDNVSADTLALLAKNRIVSLEARDAAFGTLLPGVIDISNVPDPATP